MVFEAGKFSAFCNLIAVGIKNANVPIRSNKIISAGESQQLCKGAAVLQAKIKFMIVNKVSG